MLNTKQTLHTLNSITLAKFKTWSIDGDRRGDVISCSSGTLWITQQDDLKDYVVEAGKDFWVTRPGTVVVQALENAQFKYSLEELQSHVEPNRQLLHHAPALRTTHRLR